MIDFLKEGVPTAMETERLLVRRYRLDDDETLFSAARESVGEVYPFLPWCHPDYDIGETRQWLATIEPEWEAGKSFSFAIIRKSDGRYLGGVGLNRVDEHPTMNLGYWIRSSAIGDGIATEATIGTAGFGFTHLKVIRVEIIMSVENGASQRVAEKAGATHEGVLRNRLLLHGRGHDAHSYSLLRSELRSGPHTARSLLDTT